MKIAISASEGTMDSPIDPRFGRAKKFILVDTDTGAHEVHDNVQNLNAAQGAGIQAAQTVAGLGAQIVITGHCGPKAFRVLQAAGIQIGLLTEGTVAEAVQKCKEGHLEFASSADVDGHWA